MIFIQSIELKWQASAPWYKTGLLPIIEIINTWISLNQVNNSEAGLIFICEDGGYDASIDLWKMATEQGVRFVNPSPFPYSLSSSPAGLVAKCCNIYGPIIVLVEKEDNLPTEFNVYANQIFMQQVTHLFVVKASLYNSEYHFEATVHLYSGN